jgi:SSS family solute:Na+ symporter
MRLSTLDLGIFILYMLAVLGVGLYAARRGTRTKRDYFLAGDKLPWWMIGGSIVAANISSHHFVGVMGAAYKRGFAAMTIEWGAILIGFNALLWVFLPFYLRNGFYTVPEFLLRRYGSAARLAFAGLMLAMYIFVEMAGVLYLGGVALHKLVEIPIMTSVIILAVATGVYTIIGGLRAVVWTEMLQLVVLLCGGLALTIATLRAVGGWHAIVESSRTWHILLPHTDKDFPWTMYLGGSLCTSIFYAAANQFIVQRALAAKDEWHARMGIVFTDYLKFLTPLIIIVPGLLAPRLFPNIERPDEIFPTLVKELLPVGLVGLVMAGLLAAVMGHISGVINSCTTIATIDFYIPLTRWRAARHGGAGGTGGAGGEGATDAQAVLFGRIIGVLVVLFSILWSRVLLAQTDEPIFLYLLNKYGFFTPGIATMFLAGILWKGATHAGALAAGLLTVPMSWSLERWWPHLPFQNRTGIVFWTCVVVCVLVSLVTKRKTDEELKGLVWTRQSMRLPPEQRLREGGLRNPVIWWSIVTAATLFMYIWFA